MTKDPNDLSIFSTRDLSIIVKSGKEETTGVHFRCPCCKASLKILLQYYNPDRILIFLGVETDD
jgi:hypothetical protein